MNEQQFNLIKQSGLDRKIPIVLDDTLEYIYNIFENNKVNNILEIGTAIGYSAICFTEILSEIGTIDTIEIETERVQEAIENIKKLGLQEKINVINDDAINVMPKLIDSGMKYDYIFIDAAKGKYFDFYNYALQLLKPKGIIIADNVLYKGMVLGNYTGHKQRTAVRKLREFLEYSQNIENIKSEIVDIGDGILISYFKEKN